uniref:Bacterial dnaA protein n=1 Tax=Podoviridae sp. cty7j44 TaxID=2826593 RepID=A0A8S5QZ28_9CAUD|nr:MAG TPA: Bacterial dnaA protein [Podoviridae sp. cty7j44]
MFNYMFLVGDRMCGKSYIINNQTTILYIKPDKIARRTIGSAALTNVTNFVARNLCAPCKTMAIDYEDLLPNTATLFSMIDFLIDKKDNFKIIILINSRDYQEFINTNEFKKLNNMYKRSVRENL